LPSNIKSVLIVCNWWERGRIRRPAEPFSGAALAGFAGQRRTRNMHSSVRDLLLRELFPPIEGKEDVREPQSVHAEEQSYE
jgi:hypothetical protein